ncbi:unnamed protein product [Rotaria sp. Silwood2]|nr:unnamed protein product [Rotaria sp. Silwood2]CAF2969551.1 unnamed protein product [Rotaria sp. Silwood2]CAF4177412.1 unnamed protein product [Rotaria sp. Silwood2]CAF4488438.1 unnamed protein product [Rotaria sp. Silwood2]
MPKNKGKGGNKCRRGKNENDDTKRELILKEDGQSYAQVDRILGNGYLEALCFDSTGGKKRLSHIRGKLHKKQWINQGDVILIGLRDYQDYRADVIMKYHADEARELKQLHEIPDNININDPSINVNDESGVVIDFYDGYNGEESKDDQKGLLNNIGHQRAGNDSPSEEELYDIEDDNINFL